ncbi:MAG: VOC family protein [Spirochaetota bacterium]
MQGRYVDHIAVLVRSIERAIDTLGLRVDHESIEEFPGEGTRELYVGDSKTPARLLLMQPIGPGPYERALAKRGAGLHHIALGTPDLLEFSDSISGTGWLLHPSSLRLAGRAKQIWLCRPGVGTLIEVSAGESAYAGTPVVTHVTVPARPEHASLIAALGLRGVAASADDSAALELAGHTIRLTDGGF